MKFIKVIKNKSVLLLSAALITSLLITGCGNKTNEPTSEPEGNYPSQNINGVVAWGAGGTTDNVARRLQPLAEQVLGKSIIMSNKAGGAGILAMQYVNDQNPDGYTLIFNAETPALYPVLGLPDLTYDEFEPIVLFTKGSSVIVVPNNSPYENFDDLIKDAKENPGRIHLGISGVGGQPYMAAAILKNIDGADFNLVPYDGDSSLITALLGNQIQVTALSVGAATQFIKNGNMKALAVMSAERNEIIPEVPSVVESNPEYKEILTASGFFNGVFVKKGTPETAIRKLKEAFMSAFNDPGFQEYAAENGMKPLGLTGEEAKLYIKKWQSQMAWLIYETGDSKVSPEKFGIPKPD
ncbi:MAG: tripartite tricarboxylate transporter substrate binding protein [Eubacteriaceae bacterium]|nr:tripartite tricarboxylate transporter substrate binding protein [Eubacteriaceae bacterium]